jgi:hypothetical protein
MSLVMEVVRSVNHFVCELAEFVIVLGHRQSPILSNKSIDKLDVISRLFVWCESRSDKCARQCNPPTDCVRWWKELTTGHVSWGSHHMKKEHRSSRGQVESLRHQMLNMMIDRTHTEHWNTVQGRTNHHNKYQSQGIRQHHQWDLSRMPVQLSKP